MISTIPMLINAICFIRIGSELVVSVFLQLFVRSHVP